MPQTRTPHGSWLHISCGVSPKQSPDLLSTHCLAGAASSSVNKFSKQVCDSELFPLCYKETGLEKPGDLLKKRRHWGGEGDRNMFISITFNVTEHTEISLHPKENSAISDRRSFLGITA